MSTKANYIKIGTFVLAAIAILIAGTIYFSANKLVQDVLMIETYVDQSVQGLDIGSPLMQRGVKIGRVENITFVEDLYPEVEDNVKYSRYVVVVMSVGKTIFNEKDDDEIERQLKKYVKSGWRLKVNYQGITGIAYMEADYVDHELNPPLEHTWKPKHMYIPWAPSTLATFKHSAEQILRKIEKVDFEEISTSLNRLLNTVNNAVADANVPEVKNELVALISEMRQTNAKVSSLMDGSGADGATITEAIQIFNQTLTNIDKLLAKQETEVNEIMDNLQKMSRNLKELSDYARRYPSQIFFVKPPPRSETVE